MAQATTNIDVTSPGLLERFGNFLVQMVENNHRVRRVEYLQSLSDEELAERGLRRDNIVHHVFADVMYT